MKKTMKCLVAVFVMALAFVMTGTTAKAEETKRLNDDLVLDLNVTSEISNVGEGTYTGGGVTGLQQTAATLNSVTISWAPAAGAVGYAVCDYSTGSLVLVAQVTETSYTFTNLAENTAALIIVMPVDAANNLGAASGQYGSVAVYTQPTKIPKVDYYNQAFAGKNKLTVGWSASPIAEGYDVVLYDRKGNVKQKATLGWKQNDVYGVYSTKFSKSNTQNIYKVVITPYITIKNGTEKVNGAKSTFYAVPQARRTSKDSDIGINSFNLKWKKVNGATKYEVYVSTKKTSGFKKVATVNKNKTSYKITKYKGKTINTLNKKYYIKLVTVAKFGKKTVKSKTNIVTSIYSYYK